jgi:hypothetical protein
MVTSVTALGLLKVADDHVTPESPELVGPAGVHPRSIRAKLMYDSPWWRLYEGDIVRLDG